MRKERVTSDLRESKFYCFFFLISNTMADTLNFKVYYYYYSLKIATLLSFNLHISSNNKGTLYIAKLIWYTGCLVTINDKLNAHILGTIFSPISILREVQFLKGAFLNTVFCLISRKLRVIIKSTKLYVIHKMVSASFQNLDGESKNYHNILWGWF